MPRYKLRLADPGDHIYCEGTPVYVGETATEALDFYADEYEWLEVEWVHPEILRGRVVRAADIENGDCHEDAERGDTTYDLVTSDPVNALRPLQEGEIRTWPDGSWRPGWSLKPEWATGDAGWRATVGGTVVGQFATQDEAELARDYAESDQIRAWKAAHPEFHRPLPDEPDDTPSREQK